MNLKARRHLEAQKKIVQEKLAARVAMLKENGMDPRQLDKNPQVRKLKAEIRKADARLRSVSAAENLSLQMVQKKKDKAEGKFPASDPAEAKAAGKTSDKPSVKKKKAQAE